MSEPGPQPRPAQPRKPPPAPAASVEPPRGGFVDPLPGQRAHCCSCCECPIVIYGRLTPCLHAFCLQCASGMEACFM